MKPTHISTNMKVAALCFNDISTASLRTPIQHIFEKWYRSSLYSVITRSWEDKGRRNLYADQHQRDGKNKITFR